MDRPWWQQPVRMLRVDYVPDYSTVSYEDPGRLARRRRDDWQINCEWIVGTPGIEGLAHLTTFDPHPVNGFLPVTDVTIRRRLDKEPKNVHARREKEKIKTKSTAGAFAITAPKLMMYEVIVIES